MSAKPNIVILAAGKGKRMHSTLPKVLHPILFRPMISYVVDLSKAIPHSGIFVVVGHGEKLVRDALSEFTGIRCVTQETQLGTADAVKSVSSFLTGKSEPTLVLSGDVILLTKNTLTSLVEFHDTTGSKATLLSTELNEPKGYGRILRDKKGLVVGIREEADCSVEEASIREINCGIYVFDTKLLLEALGKVGNKNQQKEYYLTDVIGYAVRGGHKVSGVKLADWEEALGINDRKALIQVEGILRNRINQEWLYKGVTISSPSSVTIDPRTVLAADVTIEPGVILINSKVASHVVLESNSRVIQSELGETTRIKQGSYIEKSVVGKECTVGPYAHFRPGSVLKDRVKIGNFVEVKMSEMGEGSKASHLSYIGDAEVGRDVNIGCGFVTCNYDGVNKHKTILEDGVFVGSDSQTVAPVKIGAGSYVASGTTVTKDVPADSLVFSRGRQVVKSGYAKKLNPPKK